MYLSISQNDVKSFQFEVVSYVSMGLLVFHTCIEISQIVATWKEGMTIAGSFGLVIHRYLFDSWNFIDLSIIGLWLTCYSLRGTDEDDPTLQFLCALGVLSIWAKILYFGRGIKAYSILIEILRRITIDMKYFMLLLGTFLGAFAVAFRCLKVDKSVGRSLLRVYDMMFGEFDSGVFGDDSSVPEYTMPLFVLFLFIVPLILLNSLIALMGDSYGIAQENAKSVYLLSRANLIVEYETIGFDRILRWLRSLRKCCSFHLEGNEPNSDFDGDDELMVFIAEECGVPDPKRIIDYDSKTVNHDHKAKESIDQLIRTIQSENEELKTFVSQLVEDQNDRMSIMSDKVDTISRTNQPPSPLNLDDGERKSMKKRFTTRPSSHHQSSKDHLTSSMNHPSSLNLSIDTSPSSSLKEQIL